MTIAEDNKKWVEENREDLYSLHLLLPKKEFENIIEQLDDSNIQYTICHELVNQILTMFYSINRKVAIEGPGFSGELYSPSGGGHSRREVVQILEDMLVIKNHMRRL